MRAPDFERWIAEHGTTVHLAAMLAHTSIQNCILQERRDEVCLSNREKECLLRVAQGVRISRIADRLGIAEVTVAMHLTNANRKLGAATREQAVAQAVLLQNIVP